MFAIPASTAAGYPKRKRAELVELSLFPPPVDTGILPIPAASWLSQAAACFHPLSATLADLGSAIQACPPPARAQRAWRALLRWMWPGWLPAAAAGDLTSGGSTAAGCAGGDATLAASGRRRSPTAAFT
jgi:hypothetical protein